MTVREDMLYLRVTRALEDDILSGVIREGEPAGYCPPGLGRHGGGHGKVR